MRTSIVSFDVEQSRFSVLSCASIVTKVMDNDTNGFIIDCSLLLVEVSLLGLLELSIKSAVFTTNEANALNCYTES